MIELNDISVGHQKKLFHADNLIFEAGQLIVLIGPNGSGKTTFFNTLLGTHPVLSGEITVRGKELAKLSKIDRVKSFALVPSRFNGVDHLTVRQLIALGRSPYTNMLNRLNREDNRKVDEVMEQLNIGHLANMPTTQISDGERQIAMIGKALAQGTSCVILDEPTAFLDYSNRKKVLQLLKELVIEEHKLILVSSHDIELSLQYANQVIAINKNSGVLCRFNPPFQKDEITSSTFD